MTEYSVNGQLLLCIIFYALFGLGWDYSHSIVAGGLEEMS